MMETNNTNLRLVELPCEIGSAVFTLAEVLFPCHVCEAMGRTALSECYKLNSSHPFQGAPHECPTNIYEIQKHTCRGFEVCGDANGIPIVSLAGEWGYEGFEAFTGCDGKQYYSQIDAKAALQKILEGIEHEQ